jgi:hypothetical protein
MASALLSRVAAVIDDGKQGTDVFADIEVQAWPIGFNLIRAWGARGGNRSEIVFFVG